MFNAFVYSMFHNLWGYVGILMLCGVVYLAWRQFQLDGDLDIVKMFGGQVFAFVAIAAAVILAAVMVVEAPRDAVRRGLESRFLPIYTVINVGSVCTLYALVLYSAARLTGWCRHGYLCEVQRDLKWRMLRTARDVAAMVSDPTEPEIRIVPEDVWDGDEIMWTLWEAQWSDDPDTRAWAREVWGERAANSRR